MPTIGLEPITLKRTDFKSVVFTNFTKQALFIMNLKIINYLQLHFLELKINLFIFFISFIYLFLISFYFSDQLIFLLSKQFIQLKMLTYFIFTNVTDFFLIKMYISFFCSFIIIIIIIVFQGWYFISKGLFQYENLKIFTNQWRTQDFFSGWGGGGARSPVGIFLKILLKVNVNNRFEKTYRIQECFNHSILFSHLLR